MKINRVIFCILFSFSYLCSRKQPTKKKVKQSEQNNEEKIIINGRYGADGDGGNGAKRDGREHQEVGGTHPEDDVRHLF